MSEAKDRCQKCGGTMENGFLLDATSPSSGRPVLWIEGSQIGIKVKAKRRDPGQIEVDAYRCEGCGYLELYAGVG